MKKISVKDTKNRVFASGKTKNLLAAGSADDERLRKRVKHAVKTIAVPPDLESKVLNLLR